jgi:phosphoribosyl 1,2-cyclic phosphodiesterase
LLDCGLSPEELERRLERLGVAPSSLCAILITHEHDDHAGHAYAFAAAHGLTLFMTHGTRAALDEAGKAIRSVPVKVIRSGLEAPIDGLSVRPFTVPHDAREPVQFVISDGARRVGVLTDLGASTAHVEAMLSGVEALVLECNHDLDMLWAGGYPSWLKKRIAGPFGHLNNGASQKLLAALDRSRLQHVIAAHLSQHNNKPELARGALARALGCEEEWIGIASQEEGFGWRDLR